MPQFITSNLRYYPHHAQECTKGAMPVNRPSEISQNDNVSLNPR
ncbi:hypothetical protein MiSe_63930 [Microseira wollei NIES-4236]|uniref:Uncharacterized protein n=1 Tax=Microseira wollei NIES-4236 TaxID=2530354 RepID=A0AAV3XJ91_9CYAN|nr:hypothetical protein MiSe_63930 [Microseira wollei NIES-4236]